jgi:hypothetical protein
MKLENCLIWYETFTCLLSLFSFISFYLILSFVCRMRASKVVEPKLVLKG